MVFARASSSDVTGIALEDSEANRFTIDISSTIEEVLPDSLKIERSFFRIKDGGAPKPGPVSRVNANSMSYQLCYPQGKPCKCIGITQKHKNNKYTKIKIILPLHS
jgi:hypothetical protein